MIRAFLMALLICLALAPMAGAQEMLPRSLALKQPAALTAPDGESITNLPAYSLLEFIATSDDRYLAARFGPDGRRVQGRLLKPLSKRTWPDMWLFQPRGLPGPWWVPRDAVLSPDDPEPGQEASVGMELWGYVPKATAVLLAGPASYHAARLARLRGAKLPPATALRLLGGQVAMGDNFLMAEMAWGKPQRSFMVNYLSDEQHYVYLTPKGPVVLRFEGGVVVNPIPSDGRLQTP